MDLELTFLDGFVQQKVLEGQAQYNQSKSLSDASNNLASSSTLNFKAYQQEVPKYPTFSDPESKL